MLLIDGVKYELWTPPTEDEFEQIVKDHAQEIFGEQSIYLDRKQKLKSLSGIGSIPDGYALILSSTPFWYIVEIELSGHNVFDHVTPQVNRFSAGIRNLASQKAVADVIYKHILGDKRLKEQINSKIGSTDIYKFLTDLVCQPPKLAIIIDKETEEIRDVIEQVKLETDVVELRTFVSDSYKNRRAYLFEPLTSIEEDVKGILNWLRQEVNRKRPSLRPAKPAKHYCKLDTGHKRVHLEWLFHGSKVLGVELHLERTTNTENSQLFRMLESRRVELENSIGEPLTFQPLWIGGYSRLYTIKTVNKTPGFKLWAVDTMIKFYDVFKPLLDEIEVV